jgi:predicted GIY-YIG superfamily endonuclease
VFLDQKGKPYYVGRTNDLKRRRKEHLDEIRKGNRLPKYNAARKLIKSGHAFRMRSVAAADTLDDIMELEKFFIQRYRKLGYTLYNLTSGGDDKKKLKINYPRRGSLKRNRAKKVYRKKR